MKWFLKFKKNVNWFNWKCHEFFILKMSWFFYVYKQKFSCFLDLSEPLNKIDHKTCLSRPYLYKGENIEDRDQGKDLDILSIYMI